MHYRAIRGVAHRELKQLEPAIADLEAALAHDANDFVVQESLAECCRLRAYTMVIGQEPHRDLRRALVLARRALELAPGEINPINTMAVVNYRAGLYADAIAFLDRALIRRNGEVDPLSLFYRAMAHHRLGNRTEARAAFDHAVRWLSQRRFHDQSLVQGWARLRAEAEAVLAGAGRAAGRRLRPHALIKSPTCDRLWTSCSTPRPALGLL